MEQSIINSDNAEVAVNTLVTASIVISMDRNNSLINLELIVMELFLITLMILRMESSVMSVVQAIN